MARRPGNPSSSRVARGIQGAQNHERRGPAGSNPTKAREGRRGAARSRGRGCAGRAVRLVPAVNSRALRPAQARGGWGGKGRLCGFHSLSTAERERMSRSAALFKLAGAAMRLHSGYMEPLCAAAGLGDHAPRRPRTNVHTPRSGPAPGNRAGRSAHPRAALARPAARGRPCGRRRNHSARGGAGWVAQKSPAAARWRRGRSPGAGRPGGGTPGAPGSAIAWSL